MLYQISNGAVAFGDDVILHSIDFEIRNTEKIAIVGRNGCGKTTLLKLISGEVEMEKLDSDESAFIAKAGNPEIGYLKQIAFDDPDVTLEQEVRKCFVKMDERKAELARAAAELEHDYSDEKVARYTAMEEAFKDDGGYYYEKEYEVMIRKFGFSDDERKKPIRDFSGGQQTKIAFIKLLLSKPDILLLDEPTNHLDVTTIEWLEGYLKSYPKAVVVVSHDRMFLDNVVDVVYEIEYGTARRYPGNYTNFIARKKENYDKQMKDHIAQQKEIERLQRMVTRFKGKPTKTAMAQSKQKAIDRMVIIEAPDKYDNKTFHANFQPEKETGNDVLYTSELAIGYDHPLSVVSLDLKRGEKLGILGGNGLGKSTFLKTIVGKIPALSGEYRFGTNVQIGYFDQQMAMYTSNKTVLDDFWDEYPNLTETEARNALGAFLFSGDDVFKNVNMLSGGEKVRLALCKILKTRPNVLVLDEPTNHMDIVGKETLESMLKDYKGTLIFVSHDRYFVKKVATQLLVFEDGTTNLYQFGYEQYQEKLDREASESKNVYRGNAIFGGAISQNGSSQTGGSQTGSDANRSTSQTGAAGNVGESTNANSAAQAGGMAVSSTGKAYYNPGKERSKIQKKVKKAEEDLAVKEAKLDELKAELMKPEYQSSYSKLTEIQNEIDALEEEILIDMEAWEELSSQLETLG
ncbi:MAG: ABC-F family ATP-binding cassette domain-containing protein [Agathobacter rectalis]